MIEPVWQLLAARHAQPGAVALTRLGLADGRHAAALARRSGQGGLTLCGLSRTLPLEENEKARSKRLYRRLRNASLDGPERTPG